jgi:hypothetical protein
MSLLRKISKLSKVAYSQAEPFSQKERLPAPGCQLIVDKLTHKQYRQACAEPRLDAEELRVFGDRPDRRSGFRTAHGEVGLPLLPRDHHLPMDDRDRREILERLASRVPDIASDRRFEICLLGAEDLRCSVRIAALVGHHSFVPSALFCWPFSRLNLINKP